MVAQNAEFTDREAAKSQSTLPFQEAGPSKRGGGEPTHPRVRQETHAVAQLAQPVLKKAAEQPPTTLWKILVEKKKCE